MRELSLGEYIKQERIRQGITQEQLCEGICEPITISRMENGKQIPSYTRICTFLQRLGLPDDQYFALLNQNELEIKTLQDEIRADIIRFGRAKPENRPAIRASGIQKLEKLECTNERIIQQYILAMRGSFGTPQGAYSPKERLELLLETLHITVPNCNLEEIGLGLYSLDETSLISQIANVYADMGQLNKSIDIYRQLLKYIHKHYSKISRYAGKVALVSHNYTQVLLISGRYKDAFEIAELGRNICVKYNHYQFLPGILDLIGEYHYYKGSLEKCKEYYRDAYCLYKVIGNDRDRLLLEKMAKEQLNMDFCF